jgi:formate transporter
VNTNISKNRNQAITLLSNDHSLNKQTKDTALVNFENYGKSKIQKSNVKSFALAIFAGIFIAIGFVFYITVTTGANELPWGFVRLMGGLAFSLGLILVVVCGGELFTSTVLSTVGWAQGLYSTKQLLMCWARVYLGNLIGAAILVALIMIAKMHLLDDGNWGINALQIAQHKIHHSWSQAFALGLLCNLLVCLAIWMTMYSKDMLTKSMLLIMPVAMFVSSGFEHSIANMFMVPLGIAINNLSTAEFFIAHGFSSTQFADLTWSNFINNNLIPVTLGNVVGGGLFVGLGYWLTAKETLHPTNLKSIKKTIKGIPMKKTLSTIKVNDVMNADPLVLLQTQSIYQALSLLTAQDLQGAPVVDQQQNLVGFISQQDLMKHLWSEQYSLELTIDVSDIMQAEVLSVESDESILALLEFMLIDQEVLYPVNNSGMLTSYKSQSYEQRLQDASAQRPCIYPVVKQGVLCGVITRKQIAKLLTKQYQIDGVSDKKVA